MKYNVFVDGKEGTTGLKIHDYLSKRNDLNILEIDPEKRKDTKARSCLINAADIVFLCLPDEAAKESVSLITNENTCVIDASTAHRTNSDWVYGFPELSKSHRELIKSAKRVANPGCHATAFASLVYPLIKEGVIPTDYPITCNSITGYSGGGKKLIEKFENPNSGFEASGSPKHYALDLNHKHLPEMQKVSELDYLPLFTPVVSNYYKGMVVSIPLITRLMSKKVNAKDVWEMFYKYYESEFFVNVMPFDSKLAVNEGFLNAEGCNDTNRIDIFVFGNDNQIHVLARLDNLGKGASGAAIQNMNIMFGLDETLGLKNK